MSSKNKTIKRGVDLYIDGKQIKNDIASVERECRKLTKELKSMEIGSKEYQAQAAKVKELNGILAEHRESMRAANNESKSMLEGLNDWVGKWGALLATATAGIAALGMAINKYRTELLERGDTKADVKALTGLDDESIAWLEGVAVKLSTTMTESGIRIRQSATEILDAFKLVGSAKPELLTDKEALAEVTEQAMILAQASGIDLKQAVDAVTLSMNQYGAAANEAARYANVMAAGSKYGAAAVDSVTVAVKKSGVAASTANVPIEQLVGSIEALAEKGIKDAVAGTGLKTFFLKLEKQASDVRPSVVGLQTALENLAKKNLSTNKMIKMFGLEAYTVAQALVQSTEQVKHYTDAVTGTDTAMEQASIKSDTAAAKLAQLKNQLTENGMVLAEQIAPVIQKFLGWTNKTVQVLPQLFSLFAKIQGTLIAVAAATTAYMIAEKASIAIDKVKVLWNEKILVSLTNIGNFLKKNPWLVAITAIGVLIDVMRQLHKEIDKSINKNKELKRIQEEAANSTQHEKNEIERLNKVVHDSKASYETRKSAIEDLQKIVPNYHASLTKEGELINDNVDAIKTYVSMLTLQAQAEAASASLVEAQAAKRGYVKQNEERVSEVAIARNTYNRQHGAFYVPSANEKIYDSPEEAAADMFGITPAVFRVIDDTLKELQDDVDLYEGIIAEVEDKMAKVKEMNSTVSTDPASPSSTEPEDKKRVRKELLRIDAIYNQKEAELKLSYIQGDIESQQQYTDMLKALEVERLNEKMKVVGLEESQRTEFLNKIMDIEIQMRQRIDKMLIDNKNLSLQEELELLKKNYTEQYNLLVDAYEMGVIPTEQKFYEYRRRLIELYNKEKQTLEEKDAERQKKLQEEITKKQEEEEKKRLEILQKKIEENKSIAEEIAESMEEVGESLAEAIFGEDQKEAWNNMWKEFLKDAVTMLEKYIMIKQTQLLVDALAASGGSLTGAVAWAGARMALIKTAAGALRGTINNLYTGGFTGPGKWDEPKGVVHSNEFVANRFATQNPNIAPVLSLIDAAQRSGSVRNLSGADIAAVALHNNASSATSAQNDIVMANLIAVMARVENTLNKATEAYKTPSRSYCYVKGDGGIEQAMDMMKRLKQNATVK